MKRVLVTSLFLLASAITFAGGYRVGLQGQRALAMGHTGVAYVNSAELAFFNPAGLVFLENKINASAGGFGVFSSVAWQNEGTGQYAQTDSPMSTPFYLYGSYALNENLSLGLAVYTPYGSTVEWPTDWAGSHLVNNIELAAIFIQPLVSFKISDKFSVGGGPIFVTGNVNFNRNANRFLTDLEGNRSNVTIDDSGVTNWGYSVGAMFKVTEDFTLGANYRSEIILDSKDGTATFANFPNDSGAPITVGTTTIPSNGTTGFTASLPLPAELTVGGSYSKDKWVVNFDYTRTFWDVYEDLDIVFSNGQESINPRNYKNSSIYKVGFGYSASERIMLRAGYYFDESPVRSGYFAPETPRNDSNGFTAGLSYVISDSFAIDASFLYVRFKEINESYDYVDDGSSFGGAYKSSAFVPGIGLTYKL
ncbi:OmpP1/FadL family transporter [Leeuwenhoekiella polynyae]|uniref:Long-chain fatty acid transport protein n=1 Tax=Leeuwenhoekiella polynyae TaxID=1550906 RepID=A0A4Q0P0C6_9FLAO|nr:outer membrane protein transport protein [Leeuwenhoekiella polynyae]RXG18607.1 long-chain fatty acid transport protein [Leeuwenhoekiella polynyae]